MPERESRCRSQPLRILLIAVVELLLRGAAVEASGAYSRGDADCNLLRSAADTLALARGLAAATVCGNDDCDRDGLVTAADRDCAARCLFGRCAIPPHAPVVVALTPLSAGRLQPLSTALVSGFHFDGAGPLAVTVGGLPAEILRQDPGSALEVLLPALAPGAVELVVADGDLAGPPFSFDLQAAQPVGVRDSFASALALLETTAAALAALPLEDVYGADAPRVREGLGRLRDETATAIAALGSLPGEQASALDAHLEATGMGEELRLVLATLEAAAGGGGATITPTVVVGAATRVAAATRVIGAATALAAGAVGLPEIVLIGGSLAVIAKTLQQFLRAGEPHRGLSVWGLRYRTAEGVTRARPTAGGSILVIASGEAALLRSLSPVLEVRHRGGTLELEPERVADGEIEFRLPLEESGLCNVALFRIRSDSDGSAIDLGLLPVTPELVELLHGTGRPGDRVLLRVRGVGACDVRLMLTRGAEDVGTQAVLLARSWEGIGSYEAYVPLLPPSSYRAQVVTVLPSEEERTLRIDSTADAVQIHCSLADPARLTVAPGAPSTATCVAVARRDDIHETVEWPSGLTFDWSSSPAGVLDVRPGVEGEIADLIARRPGRAEVAVRVSYRGAALAPSTPKVVEVADVTAPSATLESDSPRLLSPGDSIALRVRGRDNAEMRSLRLLATGDLVLDGDQTLPCLPDEVACSHSFRVDLAGAAAAGEVEVVAEAEDRSGNRARSAPLLFTIQSPPSPTASPSPSPTPTAGTPSPARVVAYVVSDLQDALTVVDVAARVVIDHIPVGPAPRGLAFAPDGRRAYVAITGRDTVAVIDTASHTVVDEIDVGDTPWDLAITPDGERAYVLNFAAESVSVVDLASLAVVATVPMRSSTADVGITPDGARIYVAVAPGVFSPNNFREVAVIGRSANAIVKRFESAPVFDAFSPVDLAIAPGGGRVFVHDGAQTMKVLDDDVLAELRTLPFRRGVSLAGMAFPPDGARLWVAQRGDDSVAVLDPVAEVVEDEIGLPGAPSHLAFTPDGAELWASLALSSRVSVIGVAGRSVATTIDLGRRAGPIAIADVGERTPTFTATATRTATPSRTGTATLTRTPTLTSAPTSTRTPTASATPTRTRTRTRTPTFSAAPGSTRTPTATPVPPARIEGRVFHDLDRDGVREAGEPGLFEWVVYVDENGDGVLNGILGMEDLCAGALEPCDVAEPDGHWFLADLEDGEHVVRAVRRLGWQPTTIEPAALAITRALRTYAGIDFGFAPEATPSRTPTRTATRTQAAATTTSTASPSPTRSATRAATAAAGREICRVLTPRPIPDADSAGIVDVLQVAPGGAIADLNVRLRIRHTWVSDLFVRLTHVASGRSVVLYDSVGCGVDDIDAVFDDEAFERVTTVCASQPPAVGGSVQAFGVLSTFDGADANGLWQLTVVDQISGDFGNLDGWCLRINQP